ncbi:MAG: OmpH family outer membrane protein [Planctomycetota bacterium]
MGRWVFAGGVLMLVAAVPFVWGGAQGSGTQGKAAPSQALGVVDLGRLLKEAPNLTTGLKGLEEWVAARQKEIDEKEKRLRSLEENLQLYDKTSEEYLTEKDRWDVEKYMLDLFVKKLYREKDARLVGINARCYEEFAAAAGKVAKAKGLSLVLQVGPTPVGSKSEEEFLARLVRRNVLWADDALDITADVLTILTQ